MKGTQRHYFHRTERRWHKDCKTLTVQVDALYDVEPEWALFAVQPCGKDPGYGTMLPDPVSGGNGGLKGLCCSLLVGCLSGINGQAPREGAGASMTFTIAGARLIKNYNDGTSVQGSFTFDMSKIILDDGGNVWAKGKLNTKNVTVLCGKSPTKAEHLLTAMTS